MKKIKEVYKEVEKEKDNEVEDNKVTMKLCDFVKEHQKLPKILREGTREELLAEANEQEEELEKELKSRGLSEEDFEEED